MRARQLKRSYTVNKSFADLFLDKFKFTCAHLRLSYNNPCDKDFLCIAQMHILVDIYPTFTLSLKALRYYGTMAVRVYRAEFVVQLITSPDGEVAVVCCDSNNTNAGEGLNRKALRYYGTKTLSGIDIILPLLGEDSRVDFSLPSKNNTNAGNKISHLPLLGEVAESRRGIDKLCERGRNSREVLRKQGRGIDYNNIHPFGLSPISPSGAIKKQVQDDNLSVMLNLFQHLKNNRFRNEFGMTKNNGTLNKQPVILNNKENCHAELVSASFGRVTINRFRNEFGMTTESRCA